MNNKSKGPGNAGCDDEFCEERSSGIAIRILRIILIPFLSLIPVILIYDLFYWIYSGKNLDSGRKFLCYVYCGKWEALIAIAFLCGLQ